MSPTSTTPLVAALNSTTFGPNRPVAVTVRRSPAFAANTSQASSEPPLVVAVNVPPPAAKVPLMTSIGANTVRCEALAGAATDRQPTHAAILIELRSLYIWVASAFWQG